ncbi:MAG: hypothetical protein OEY14_18860, partial [Myxococcales bacterium]|nr:hypothetical protein [Myxococcales bacterium]
MPAPLPGETPEQAEARRLDAEYPLHGVVIGIQVRILMEPNADAPVVGWLRVGARVRLGSETRDAPGCRGGYRPVHPLGWSCLGDGIEAREAPIPIEAPTDEGWKNDQLELAAARGALVLPPTAQDAPLPYAYYYVKDSTVPEFHRLPSRDEQRAAQRKADHYRELFALNEDRARRYMAGELEGPAGTAVTHRYLDRGFFVASTGIEVRASRNFVRTTQGRFIKRSQLEERSGSEFVGVELGGSLHLPIAWALRPLQPLRAIEAEDGSTSWQEDPEATPIERLDRLETWRERRNIGGRVMHILEGERYLRDWHASVAH